MDSGPSKFWRKLPERPPKEQAAYEAALELLAETPRPLENPPGVIKHLKGGYLCHFEYRRLPNAQRIYYKLFDKDEVIRERPDIEWDDDNQLGMVLIFYAGPHPPMNPGS